MKTKHENIGQWLVSLYQHENDYLLKLCAVLPTTEPAARCRLLCMEELSDEDFGLVYRLENAESINVESSAQSYLVCKETKNGKCPYKKVVIIGFQPRANPSFLIAICPIEEGISEL